MLALLVIALVATQNRGGLLGAVAGAMVWLSFHTDRLRMIAKAATVAAIGLTLASLLAVSIPVGGLQGRSFSTDQLVENVHRAAMRAAELMVHEAARKYDAGEDIGAEANMAKLLAADASWAAGHKLPRWEDTARTIAGVIEELTG